MIQTTGLERSTTATSSPGSSPRLPRLPTSTSFKRVWGEHNHDWALWAGILILATAIALDVQTVPQFQTYALSALGSLSWSASFSGIANFVNATARPLIARLADRYGHFQLFLALIVILVAGFMLSAASQSIVLFALGQCLTAFGQIGIQFSHAIISAENSALSNRALATALPMSPFALTVFFVAPISEALLPDRWRLGYGIWALVVPFASVPLLVLLWRTDRQCRKSLVKEILRESQEDLEEETPTGALDTTGLVLFVLSLGMIFFATTPKNHDQSKRPPVVLPTPINGTPPVAETTIGAAYNVNYTLLAGLLTLGFFLHHQLKTSTTMPILALRFLGNQTIAAGCATTFFYFLCFSLYQPYLFPYLTLAGHLSIRDATNANLIFMFSSIIFGLLASFVLKYSRRYRKLALAGTYVRLLAAVVMLHLTRASTEKWAIFGYQAFAGAGMGIGSWVVQVGVQAALTQHTCTKSVDKEATIVGPHQLSSLLALYATFGSLGGFLGDALSSTLFTPLLAQALTISLPDVITSPPGHGGHSRSDWISSIIRSAAVAGQFQPGTVERIAIDESWASTLRSLHVWSCAVLVLACASVLWLADIALDDRIETANHHGEHSRSAESTPLLHE